LPAVVGQFAVFVAGLQAMSFKPIQVETSTGQNLVCGDGFACRHRKLVVTAGKVTPGFGFGGMNFKKIAPRYAVAVCKNEVVGLGLKNRNVKDSALPEAIVFLPYVLYDKTGIVPHAIDQLAGLNFRTIVSNDQFEVAMGLHAVAPEYFFQPLGRVIGTDNDGKLHGPESGALACGLLIEVTSVSPSPV